MLPSILILLITHNVVGESTVGQIPPIKVALRGANITFYCTFPVFQEESDVKVQWWRHGDDEFLNDGEASNRQYKLLKKGGAAIHLLNVSFKDSGRYYCSVYCRGGMFGNGTGSELLVAVPPTPLRIDLVESEFRPSTSPILLCKTAKFYPEDLNVTWYKNNAKIVTGINTTKQQTRVGLYEISSTLKDTTLSYSGATYSCQVSHVSLETPANVSYNLEGHPGNN
ncbi:tapasin-related protein-like isoform X2 [Heterodontus francisci]|uniref:tapasin-related protein-like isoform X2 n=1 Tax=Heterodontus francisci TaxID=7792 RepID=UPI00355C03CC